MASADHDAAVTAAATDAERMHKLSKRLSYLLRHSDSIDFFEGGWCRVADLPLPRVDVHAAQRTSFSLMNKPPNSHRFELMTHPQHGELVRAKYGHSFAAEAKPRLDGGARIHTLQHLCCEAVYRRIKDYGNLGELPDFLCDTLLQGAKARKILSTPVLKSFATEHVTNLDLGGCVLTPTNLEFVAKHCGSLCSLGLSGCYALNDHALTMLAKRCKRLRSLDLSGCRNLTQRGIDQLALHARALEYLGLTGASESLDLARLREALPHCELDQGAPLCWSKAHYAAAPAVANGAGPGRSPGPGLTPSPPRGGGAAGPPRPRLEESQPGVFLESLQERGVLLEFRAGERTAWRTHRVVGSSGFGKQRSVLLLSRASDGRRFYNVLRPHQGEFAGQCGEGDPEPQLHAHHRPWRDGERGRWTPWAHAIYTQKLGYKVDSDRRRSCGEGEGEGVDQEDVESATGGPADDQ